MLPCCCCPGCWCCCRRCSVLRASSWLRLCAWDAECRRSPGQHVLSDSRVRKHRRGRGAGNTRPEATSGPGRRRGASRLSNVPGKHHVLKQYFLERVAHQQTWQSCDELLFRPCRRQAVTCGQPPQPGEKQGHRKALAQGRCSIRSARRWCPTL